MLDMRISIRLLFCTSIALLVISCGKETVTDEQK
jgi:hypothetical protein